MACSWCKRGSILLIASVAILAAVIARFSFSHTRLSLPATVYWGPRRVPPGSAPPKDDESIKEFTINFEADLIARLREDIKTSTWVDPLEDNAYHDGVNLRTFRDLMEYWRTKYDFNKSLAEINAYPHYKTEIEGLKIHFLQSKAEPKSTNVEVIPLLLIHGWPGSFAEFLKVIPLLNAAKNGIAFDVVVPSLPGFGYSDAPSRRGVDAVVAARIFKKLMARLGYSRYIVQGGDWGSVVTSAMGSLFPDDVRGIHLNLLFSFPQSFMDLSKLLLVRTFPKYFADGPLPRCMSFEAKGAFQEMAYFYMQATKPDTLGLAHLNSAVGLAAYIMEKFAVATDPKYLDLDDGGFGRRIPLDHVFTNLMVYYTSKSAISSYRFYKENIVTGNFFHLYKDPIKVPTGYAIFPNDIGCSPTFIAKGLLPNLTTLTYQKSGGHFAAMEEPAALADDIRQFVEKLVELYPERR